MSRLYYQIRKRIPEPLRPLLKTPVDWLQGVRQGFQDPHLTETELESFLIQLGFTPGATILLHSAMEEIKKAAPTLPPVKLIQLMQKLLGEEGTLLMPTFPFRGRQIDFLDRTPTVDLRKAPSKVGLLTEVFRRLPGVQRSLHPSHPVAGWGKRAGRLLDDHHKGGTFGKNSPFYRLAEIGGTVVGLGAGLESFTILCVAEEIDPHIYPLVFDAKPRIVTVVHGEQKHPCSVHPTTLSHHIFYPLQLKFLEEGVVKISTAKTLSGITGKGERIIGRYGELMHEGITLFEWPSVAVGKES
ncbi:MAG: AAC(3) family N-acetyltransferase [Magnetococcales bacterium]|nr:AAC(3) family N-acetyltransferase [Magnetococcales bacterium]